MSAIDKIGIKVVVEADRPTGNAKALLHELPGLLDSWLTKGEAASIDLRSLPLSRGDYERARRGARRRRGHRKR